MRFALGCFLFLAATAFLRADRVEDLARIHLEALGGRQRLDALAAFRATGTVGGNGRKLKFTLVAARPNRLRLETEDGGRTLVQATNGVEPPWEFDTGTWPPHYRDMAPAAAKVFQADAEFDDPLVAGAARGFVLEDAGQLETEGHTYLSVLVTHHLTETYTLLVDADTYLIAARVEQRTSAGGRALKLVTRFDDYRPVNGVLIAHQITSFVDGRPTQQTTIDMITANPELSADLFTRPKPPNNAAPAN